MAETSDQIRSNQTGSELNFDHLYLEYKQAVYRYIYYLIRRENEIEAADLFQETWLRVVKYLPAIQESKNPKAFIFTIATNLFRDHLRKKKIRDNFFFF